jgi:hypothetical protein
VKAWPAQLVVVVAGEISITPGLAALNVTLVPVKGRPPESVKSAVTFNEVWPVATRVFGLAVRVAMTPGPSLLGSDVSAAIPSALLDEHATAASGSKKTMARQRNMCDFCIPNKVTLGLKSPNFQMKYENLGLSDNPADKMARDYFCARGQNRCPPPCWWPAAGPLTSGVAYAMSVGCAPPPPYVEPLATAADWPLQVVVGITSKAPKALGSTAGIKRSRLTSPYDARWVQGQDSDLGEAPAAIAGRPIARLADIAEHSFMKMHGLTMASRPGIVYWNATTLQGMQALAPIGPPTDARCRSPRTCRASGSGTNEFDRNSIRTTLGPTSVRHCAPA